MKDEIKKLFGNSNADTCRTVNFVSVQIERLGKGFLNAFGDISDFFNFVSAFDQNRKFAAAETRHHIAGTHTIAQSFGDSDQKQIADEMS